MQAPLGPAVHRLAQGLHRVLGQTRGVARVGVIAPPEHISFSVLGKTRGVARVGMVAPPGHISQCTETAQGCSQSRGGSSS